MTKRPRYEIRRIKPESIVSFLHCSMGICCETAKFYLVRLPQLPNERESRKRRCEKHARMNAQSMGLVFPGDERNLLPDIELVSAKVHEAWMDGKLAKGITSRKLESGEEMMVPYARLSEEAKEMDRSTVRAVYNAILALGETK